MRIAILVPDAEYYSEAWDWTFDVEAEVLSAAGCTVEPVVWTQAREMARYDLILPLVAWGYHLHYERWLDLLKRAEKERWPMVNPPALLRWNSDKEYLAELAMSGVSTVPTLAVEACSEADIEEGRRRFSSDWLVIKPPVSASASGTHLLGPNDDLPISCVRQPMIIQPLIEEISRTGEYSLMLFDGEFSHAVVKRPRKGDFRVQPHLGGVTVPSKAPPGAEKLAREALAAAPAHATYARVDIIPDDAGILRIMELELIEPALYLDLAGDGGKAFRNAILRSVQKATA